MFDALWAAIVIMGESGTGEFSVVALSREMGVSRVTGNKWVRRMAEVGLVKKTRYGRYEVCRESTFISDVLDALALPPVPVWGTPKWLK